ncbi:response regulator transcription factor [Kribbella sandramycini]|uniref:DNA-binding NarL/FixJ family response regulator n=1 Tax=Kribbella sandramycini TaxID=60450 RepID=A0A7Y4NX11_9ACTN|nr:response regulator transcription factor [Kribbella sandramycini]MBB6568014.1 DNA-binding NarL/FixJ family response regulator [Kribbella sandramycini]NOL39392.1 response regulator transcription factor [Kribbella sandramycini]
MSEPIRVIVADDQQVVREGLVALLGLLADVEVTGAAANGAETVELVAQGNVDIVLMDLRMPVLDGAGATARITAEYPAVAVLVLTTYADDTSIATALRAGARGYLTKDAGRAEIGAALRATMAGQSTFDPEVTRRLVAGLAPEGPADDGLTARETEVLRLIAQGLSNPEIAARLFIGEATVKTHINNTFAKIGARHRAEAVRYAYRHGIASDS